MSGSNRGIVFAAIIGIAVICFGLGAYLTALTYPKQELYQSFGAIGRDQPAAADANSQSSVTTQPRTPCVNPRTETESDLCAQWRAARAAEKSALWAERGFWVGLIGMVGLFWTLFYTREALQDTGKATTAMLRANELAEQNQRPWLHFEIVSIGPVCVRSHPATPRFSIPFELVVKNSGVMPARHVRAELITCQPDSTEIVEDFLEVYKHHQEIQSTAIAPGASVSMRADIMIPQCVGIGSDGTWGGGRMPSFLIGVAYRDIEDSFLFYTITTVFPVDLIFAVDAPRNCKWEQQTTWMT